MEPFVSLVVPTYNRRASLERLLRSLGDQSYPRERFEVVVVDDGSTDDTPALLGQRFDFDLRPLRQPNGGPAAARNRAVEAARGELIVFVDDDVVPVPTLLAEHVAAQAGRDDLVVIGPMSPPAGLRRPAWVRWEDAKLERQYRALLAGEYPCTPRQFYTGNASLGRARFLASGGFDPTFRRAEDVELAFRLRARDASFRFEPRAEVLHYAERSYAAWSRTPYLYGRYDVVMQRDKGIHTLDMNRREIARRHPLSRLVTTGLVGRPAAHRPATATFGALARLGSALRADRLAFPALSAVFSLLYWQGVADELGGAEPVWP